MSIPLVQNNEKDSINTSIIAIKRNIERINMLLGLSNSEEIDTSKFATKEELQQAVTDLQPVDEVAIDNMHSVTSNAVAEAGSYLTEEHLTGRYWTDGKPTYSKVLTVPSNIVIDGNAYRSLGVGYPDNADTMFPPTIFNFAANTLYYNSYKPIQAASYISGGITIQAGTEIIIEYTKTTD